MDGGDGGTASVCGSVSPAQPIDGAVGTGTAGDSDSEVLDRHHRQEAAWWRWWPLLLACGLLAAVLGRFSVRYSKGVVAGASAAAAAWSSAAGGAAGTFHGFAAGPSAACFRWSHTLPVSLGGVWAPLVTTAATGDAVAAFTAEVLQDDAHLQLLLTQLSSAGRATWVTPVASSASGVGDFNVRLAHDTGNAITWVAFTVSDAAGVHASGIAVLTADGDTAASCCLGGVQCGLDDAAVTPCGADGDPAAVAYRILVTSHVAGPLPSVVVLASEASRAVLLQLQVDVHAGAVTVVASQVLGAAPANGWDFQSPLLSLSASGVAAVSPLPPLQTAAGAAGGGGGGGAVLAVGVPGANNATGAAPGSLSVVNASTLAFVWQQASSPVLPYRGLLSNAVQTPDGALVFAAVSAPGATDLRVVAVDVFSGAIQWQVADAFRTPATAGSAAGTTTPFPLFLSWSPSAVAFCSWLPTGATGAAPLLGMGAIAPFQRSFLWLTPDVACHAPIVTDDTRVYALQQEAQLLTALALQLSDGSAAWKYNVVGASTASATSLALASYERLLVGTGSVDGAPTVQAVGCASVGTSLTAAWASTKPVVVTGVVVMVCAAAAWACVWRMRRRHHVVTGAGKPPTDSRRRQRPRQRPRQRLASSSYQPGMESPPLPRRDSDAVSTGGGDTPPFDGMDERNSSAVSIQLPTRQSSQGSDVGLYFAPDASGSGSRSESGSGSGSSWWGSPSVPSLPTMDVLCSCTLARSRSTDSAAVKSFHRVQAASRPWVFTSVLLSAFVLFAVVLGAVHVTTTVSSLTSMFHDPAAFRWSALVNRPADPGAACRINNAACFCATDAAAKCPSTGCNAAFHCTGDCDAVLAVVGDCDGSVFQYSCSCNTTSCDGTTPTYNHSLLQPAGGLQHGLRRCEDHYATVAALMWGVVAVHAGCFAAEMLYRMRCRRGANRAKPGAGAGSGRESQLLLSNGSHRAGYTRGHSDSAPLVLRWREADAPLHVVCPCRPTHGLVFVTLCLVAGVAFCLAWAYVLVRRGRFCTGEVDSSARQHFLGAPTFGAPDHTVSSAILAHVAGCTFNSQWYDNDLEGAVLNASSIGMFVGVCGTAAVVACKLVLLAAFAVYRVRYAPRLQWKLGRVLCHCCRNTGATTVACGCWPVHMLWCGKPLCEGDM